MCVDLMMLRRMVMSLMASGAKIITGTFKGTTAGTALTIPLNYSGNGYPIMAMVFPTGGLGGGTAFLETIQKYAIGYFTMVKYDISETPTYSGNSAENYGTSGSLYKYSDTDADTWGTAIYVRSSNYNGGDASDSRYVCVKFIDSTTMSVYIADTSYGFMNNVEYTYQIIYSE